jgi:hypothetical protein
MSECEAESADGAAFAALKAHAEELERQLRDVEAQTAIKLRHAELKAEAVKAGIVDLDGLRLLDPSVASAESGDASAVIARLRREKPWLFGAANSSSASSPPQAAPMKRKLATEMSIEEWRTARAELLRRR